MHSRLPSGGGRSAVVPALAFLASGISFAARTVVAEDSAAPLAGKAGFCSAYDSEPAYDAELDKKIEGVSLVQLRASTLARVDSVTRELRSLSSSGANQTTRSSDEDTIGIFFGCGCFWHVQHELVMAEMKILGRSRSELTAYVGYAGGSGTGPEGKVCYHGSDDDYSRRGHTEVVHLDIPRRRFPEFAKAYWRLFEGVDRADVQDQGPEYRAAIGIPGGAKAKDLLAELGAAQEGITEQTMEVRPGKGSDPDTLGKRLVWLYDTHKYPFYQGESWHQFHDDMVERYSQAYHGLKEAQAKAGRLTETGCFKDGDASLGQPTRDGPSANSREED